MTVHKHAEIIKAKADYMESVVFCKFKGSDWIVTRVDWYDNFSFLDEYEYFLCLPQHKEACLHWLGGGNVEIDIHGEWRELKHYSDWDINSSFMEVNRIRIKPKKEKRYIGVHNSGLTTDACRLKKGAINHPMITSSNINDWQFVEIEIDV